ncbi:MtrAB system histidine kinase MtrB [Jatrophihabitans sp. YIM 134969]
MTTSTPAPLTRRIGRWTLTSGLRARRWSADLAGLIRRWTASTWRRSVSLRVAVTTAVLTGVVVLIVGIVLVGQITDGVVSAKRRAAIQQADAGLSLARSQLEAVSQGDVAGILNAFDQISSGLAATTASTAGLFQLSVRTDDPTVQAVLNRGIELPASLRRVVRDGVQATQFATVQTAGGGTGPGLIVGEPLSTRAGSFELYFLFPLDAERATVDLVQRTVLIAGLSLVLLVVLSSLLVTRQVVGPVRLAARTAERLSAGDFAQRIPVSGTDDLAKLGRSFNEMAASLQDQILRLKELSRVQQRFTSDVSHELRTPLTTIRMATELLYEGRDRFAPELARSVELLVGELDRFEALLADLLEISRYDAGVAALETEQVDVRSVVYSAVDANRVLAERHGSELVVNAPDPVVADIDARRIERVLRNLLGNALDHGNGRPVVVTVGADDDVVSMTVRDYGIGLRPGESALVFNRFWRGDPSRSRLTGGTGLGLSISLEDARLHGGWLQAWGERGHGAQFRLTLPRRRDTDVRSSPLALEPEDAHDPLPPAGEPSVPTEKVSS